MRFLAAPKGAASEAGFVSAAVGVTIRTAGGPKTMTKFKKKLLNPFALVGQGFIAGAALFFATAPSDADAPNQAPPIQSAALPDSFGA
jgi:hypothetical protein